MKFDSDNYIEFNIVNKEALSKDKIPDMIGPVKHPVHIPKVGERITITDLYDEKIYTFEVSDIEYKLYNHSFVSDQLIIVHLVWMPTNEKAE